MSPRPTVAVTHNVERNLEEIQEFLVEHGASAAFAALVDQLFESVVPNLERFPDLEPPQPSKRISISARWITSRAAASSGVGAITSRA